MTIAKKIDKRGRRKIGITYTAPDGRRCYFVYKNLWQMHRVAQKDLSAAVRAGVAGWAISESDLIDCNAKGIKMIGVIVRETGDKYLASLQQFQSSKAVPVELGKMTRVRCRMLPLSEFRHRPGSVKI
jgi:hypothetical protein